MISVKIRTEKNGHHVSGAEKIVNDSMLNIAINSLLKRCGAREYDFMNIKVSKLPNDIMIIPCIVGPSGTDKSLDEGHSKMISLLNSMGLDGKKILNIFFSLPKMRGAAIIDVDTFERLDENPERGIRVSCFDSINSDFSGKKDHRKEAKLLASKVISSQNIVCEICVTDDVDYTFGYIASKTKGYFGITHVKMPNTEWGARLFLFDNKIGKGSREEKLKKNINYLESTPVLIKEN